MGSSPADHENTTKSPPPLISPLPQSSPLPSPKRLRADRRQGRGGIFYVIPRSNSKSQGEKGKEFKRDVPCALLFVLSH